MLEDQEVEHGAFWEVRVVHCEWSVLSKVGHVQGCDWEIWRRHIPKDYENVNFSDSKGANEIKELAHPNVPSQQEALASLLLSHLQGFPIFSCLENPLQWQVSVYLLAKCTPPLADWPISMWEGATWSCSPTSPRVELVRGGRPPALASTRLAQQMVFFGSN